MSESCFHDLIFNFFINLNQICSNIFTSQLLMYIMNDPNIMTKVNWLIRCDYKYFIVVTANGILLQHESRRQSDGVCG